MAITDTINVAIVGASGVTGGSIVNGLLALTGLTVKITALTRPESLNKPANILLKERGVEVVAANLRGPLEKLVDLLSNIEVVISAIYWGSLDDEIPLATAAKAAGVKRFVQSAYNIPVAARGVTHLRDKKEVILSHIQQLRLPYTYIDVGWWYHVVLPRVASGRTEHALPLGMPDLPIALDGNIPSGLTHIRDIGRYIARIILDPRTVNKKVFVYNELYTQNQLCDLVERLTGEMPQRKYISEKCVQSWLQDALDELERNPSSDIALGVVSLREVFLASNVHGTNTPEYAKYLGYLDGKELYPDFTFLTYEDYVKEVLD
ncbi:NAD(P)-binding protein, partial [Aspergillus udagawae]